MTTNDIAILAGRLATGWVMCDQEADPVRREALETHWCRLLGAYVAAVDHEHTSPDLAPVPSPSASPAGTRPGTPQSPRVDRSRQEVA